MPLFAPMLSAVDTWVALFMIAAVVGGLLGEMRWARGSEPEHEADRSSRARRE